MTTEAIPVVDLRLLSQSELASLARSDPSAFDLRRCDDVVVPRIDRTVFNESAGSRKQTYSRLRLASRASADPSHTPQPPSIRDPDHDLILSSLRAFFAQEVSSQPLALATMPQPPPPQFLERDREVLNAKGVTVDLVALGEKVDPFGEEMRRRTEGLATVEGLLGFLTGLDGQWGSPRMKKKVVDAAGFGDHLPKGWRISIGIKKREVVPRLFCRRYISPCGKRFKSCKEVSSYILSLIGSQVASQPILQQTSESHFKHERLTHEHDPVGRAYQSDTTKEISAYPATADIFHGSTDHQKQIVLYTPSEQGNTKPNRILECDKCNLSFSGDEEYLQHLVTFHQRSAKRRKLIKTVGDGVIIKDGMFECQFCHKTFTERRRYNGHVGSHVRYQGVSSGAFPDDTITENIINPSSLTTVPCVWSEVDVSAIRIGNRSELESSAPKNVNEQHTTTSLNRELETRNQPNYCATQSAQEPCTSKSVVEHVYDHNEPQSKSNKTLDTCNGLANSTIVSPVPIDVNNVIENHSPKCNAEECMSGLIDVQIDGCDMITVRSEEVVMATVVKATEPSTCLNVVSPPTDVRDSPSEKISKMDNVLNYVPGFPSEMLVETTESVDIKSDDEAHDDNLPQSLTNMETSSGRSHNGKDLSSSDVISVIEKNGKDQKVDSEGTWIKLSSYRSVDDGGTYEDHGFTQRIGKPVSIDIDTSNFGSDFGNIHVLSDKGDDMDDTICDDLHVSGEDHGFTPIGKPVSMEMDTPNLGSDFGNIHVLADRGADMGDTIDENLHVSREQGINLNSSVPTPFCDVHDQGVGPGLGFSFNNDKRESVVKETDKDGPHLEICFQRNAEYGGDAVCDDADNDNLRIALQLNVPNMSSSWLSPSSELPILDLIPNQCEGSCAGEKHENILGFEGLSEGRIEPSDFVLLNGQAASPGSVMELDYISGLEDKRGPPIQLQWDEPVPSDVSNCKFTTVCVWCNREFNCEGDVAEMQSNTLGFMCPVCKEKLPG
ncbi:uncharacterized protein LOC120277160 [Dioscorea cayenensis subsp. rotundata]|uniref:Uncharacterized protein LOC120277160 n=1 Tax=Dioscorea cayennensis subsp. rotundata TaxID=55577 RepID=A0AB40CNV9_DIOCR|nr:uncharacterized protein LOC120277160 [Dioscorea cayenensis subsp. rotundata]